MSTLLSSLKIFRKNLQRKFFMLFAILTVIQVSAFAQATTTILVSPPTSTVTLGQSFVVNVRVDLATSGTANGVEVHLDFDRSFLQVTNITKPSAGIFTTETIPLPPDYTTMNGVGAGAGQINYAAGIPAGTTSTDFNILAITFTTTQAGTTPLNFATVFPRITRVTTTGGVVIAGPPANAPINGSVNITTCTPPIASISNSGTCNGQPFNLTLASATGVGPFDLVINGTTYNDIAVSGQITTFTPPTSNFFGAATPPSFDETDAPVTLGLKFSSSVPGFVKGVRFYSSAAATGNFTGQLWSNAGVLLANATFTSVTGDAWQQVLFTSPVLITANTTYIVSYRTAAGLYTATNSGLTSTITSGTLTAPSSGTSGGNGVYTYDAVDGIPAPHFPVSTFSAANYWVDVVFTPSQYTFDLTSVTDNGGCTNVGAPLQALTVTSVDCSTLPVTLLNLSATVQDKDVLLRWATASEIDNRGFEIQRKTPNGSWEAVGFVNGAGNSSVQLNYSFLDKNLFSGRYNYRLKQTDIDGHYKFSMVVSALIDGKEEYDVKQNYPNPFRNETTIQYTIPEKAKVNITVYDMSGRVMKVLVNGTQDAGNHAVILYARSLPSGLYYYQVQAGGFKATKKMIIQ